MGEQRAGAAGPLSGACVDNPLQLFFIFVSLFLLPSIFSQAVVVLFERARDRKNKAKHFPNGQKDRREKRSLSQARFVDAIIRDRFCR